MKTSNRIVVGITIAAIAFAAVVVVAARVMAGKAIRAEYTTEAGADRSITGSGEVVEEEVSIRSLDSIETSGVWKLEISRGETVSVRLSYPEYLADDVRVRTAGSTLDLGFDRDVSLRRGAQIPTATVVLPHLAALELSGATTARLEGLVGEALDIEMSGGTNLVGVGCVIERLRVDSSGAANIDLSDSKVRDARIGLSGAGNMTINMDGGEIRADLSGATRLVYTGEVSSRNIETSGVSSVKQR